MTERIHDGTAGGTDDVQGLPETTDTTDAPHGDGELATRDGHGELPARFENPGLPAHV